jgi:hypothetical protein
VGTTLYVDMFFFFFFKMVQDTYLSFLMLDNSYNPDVSNGFPSRNMR